MITEAAMMRAENALATEDCWLLNEKYADKLPILNDEEKNTSVPPYTQFELPRQTTIRRSKTASEFLNSLCHPCKRFCHATLDLCRSEQAARSLTYICLALFMILTILFIFWVGIFS